MRCSNRNLLIVFEGSAQCERTIDGVTIVGVPFGGLKRIEIKTMEI